MRIKGFFLFFLLLFVSFNFLFAESDTLLKKPSEKYTTYTSHDVRTGERLFFGLVPAATTSINCASCHNIGHIDTLNWNPSAMDLAKKYAHKDFNAFKIAITQPSGKVMSQIHESLDLTDEQIFQIKSYLTSLAKEGEEPVKPLLTNRIIFILLIIIFLLAFIDFAITRKIKPRLIHVLVLLTTIIFITNYVVTAAIDIGRSQNYKPDQPIKFSHKVHAGQNQTSCLYCHFSAEQSKFAGIPSASVCMNCHLFVREGKRSGKFEINKIYAALDSNKNIEWIKVHNLPDHVFFSHAQHVVAGKLDCAKCHGDVTSMDQIVQVNDLSMGWCVNCHRTTNVQFDNKFYGKYDQLYKDLREGKINKVTAEKIGGTDCMKCHY